MIFETMLGAGIYAYTEYLKHGKNSDADRIRRICRKSGLTVKYNGEEDTIKLLKSHKRDNHIEYIFKIPEGLSFKDFQKKKDILQDGLNTQKALPDVTLSDFRKLKIKGDLLKQVQRLINRKQHVRKEIELLYDKVLKIKVYDKPLPEYIEYNKDLFKRCKGWEIPIGFSRSGIIKHDLQKHAIIAGTTDYGKSNVIKYIIAYLLEHKPDDVVFSLFDLKGGLAFNRFSKCPQVNVLASNVNESHEYLKDIQQQLNEVFDHLKNNGFEDVKEAGMNKRHFIIIDEAAELASNGESDKDTKKLKVECESIMTDIARRGRAAGFYLLYSTQYPTNEAVKPQIRQQCDTRICLRLKNEIASRVVLDEEGAEQLPRIKGRAIYQTDHNIVIQTPYITNEYIKGVVENVKKEQD